MQNDPIGAIAEDVDPRIGFRFGMGGSHSSRTMMSHELQKLFRYCPPSASHEDYVEAIEKENCLGKRTVSNRRHLSQKLTELYGLDSSLPLFRVFRLLWYANEHGRRLLCLFLALARDPLLRVSAGPVLAMEPGEELLRHLLCKRLRASIRADRMNDSTVEKVVRNTSSSWTQSGHLEGRSRKFRKAIDATPMSAAYALFLGYALGARDGLMLDTFWAHVLDCDREELIALGFEAKRLGLIDMSRIGEVIAISIDPLLVDGERKLFHGEN
jgi:hypothetical protein